MIYLVGITKTRVYNSCSRLLFKRRKLNTSFIFSRGSTSTVNILAVLFGKILLRYLSTLLLALPPAKCPVRLVFFFFSIWARIILTFDYCIFYVFIFYFSYRVNVHNLREHISALK